MFKSNTWSRTSSLGATASSAQERWFAPDGRSFDLRVRFGKKVDIFGLKQQTFERFAASIEDLAKSREHMYLSENVERVPVVRRAITTRRHRRAANLAASASKSPWKMASSKS